MSWGREEGKEPGRGAVGAGEARSKESGSRGKRQAGIPRLRSRAAAQGGGEGKGQHDRDQGFSQGSREPGRKRGPA